MRQRTTWNRNEVSKRVAALSKTADPYTMNQDHVKQQPSADKYMTGDPSTWAEDVTPSSGSWKAEYSGGEVKRNEIGMPEMRSDTFNHKEKTASEEVLLKKANLCVKVARMVLKNASESVVEDQAFSFMHLPDEQLIATHDRLAAEEKQSDEDDKAMDNFPTKEANDDEQQQAPAQGQAAEQQKQAGQVPPQFKENAEAKKEEAKDEGQGQQSQEKQAKSVVVASQEMLAQMQQMMAQMQQMMAQQQGQQQAPAQGQTQQAQGQEQSQQGQQGQQDGHQASGDDIDQMLAEQQGETMADDAGIEMEAPQMDMDDDVLAPEDEVLANLFANDESESAQQMQDQGQQGQQKQAHSVRTASTRTVGTKPAGVSRLGGVTAAKTNDINRLAGIWNSAPDVSEAFGMKR